VWADANVDPITCKHFNGTTWTAAAQIPASVFPTTDLEWTIVRRDMYGRNLLACVDDGSDINTGYWNGTYWIWTDELELVASSCTRRSFGLSPDLFCENVG
jgi:hypothetical protein